MKISSRPRSTDSLRICQTGEGNSFYPPLHGIILAIFENAKNRRKKTGNLFLISCLGVPLYSGGYLVLYPLFYKLVLFKVSIILKYADMQIRLLCKLNFHTYAVDCFLKNLLDVILNILANQMLYQKQMQNHNT